MKPTTVAATILSLVAVFFPCLNHAPAQVRPGGGRLQRPPEKTTEQPRPAKSGDKKTSQDTTPAEDSAQLFGTPHQQAGTIEIWVDNQSLHASDRNIGSPEAPLRSITAAVRKAAREVGDGEALIRVLPGIYRESVQVPAHEGRGKIIIRGENAERTIISGGELLAYWQPRTNPQGGVPFFAHVDVLPEGEKTGAFYAGSVRQKKSAAQSPGPGEFVLKNGEILWMPPTGLDWRHAEITAPVHPYPADDTTSALVVISGGRVRLESITLRHCAQAQAVISVIGATEVEFHNLRLTDNEAPGFLLIGRAIASAKCKVLADSIKIFSTKTPFFSTRDTDFTLRNSLLDHGAKSSDQDDPDHAASPLIKSEGRGIVHISRCLLASQRGDLWLDFSGGEKTVLQNNTFLQAGGRTRLALSSGDFSLVGNFFLSEQNSTPGPALLEMRVPGRDSTATCQGNIFQSHVALLLLEGRRDHPPAEANANQQYKGWRFAGNCLAPGAAFRVIHGNHSIFRTGLSSTLVSLTNQMTAAQKCDEERIAEAITHAREKLRLLRD